MLFAYLPARMLLFHHKFLFFHILPFLNFFLLRYDFATFFQLSLPYLHKINCILNSFLKLAPVLIRVLGYSKDKLCGALSPLPVFSENSIETNVSVYLMFAVAIAEANMGRATAGASQIYCVIRG